LSCPVCPHGNGMFCMTFGFVSCRLLGMGDGLGFGE
jgi:hypothetical protein